MSTSLTGGQSRPFRAPAVAAGGMDPLLREVLANTMRNYDPDFAAAMTTRDEELIKQEILHGPLAKGYIYKFRGAGGQQFVGISVVGARELAYHYAGLKHHMLGKTTKRGPMFLFESYSPFDMTVRIIPELADEPDFVAVRIEMFDTKKGSAIEVAHTEMTRERRNKTWLAEHPGEDEFFDRPHAETIAWSKAYRNAVRALVPQHVQIEWLKLNEDNQETLTEDVLGEKRSAVIRYAVSKSVALARENVEKLTMDQISGLSDAAREGNTAAFVQSCQALGILASAEFQAKTGPVAVGGTKQQEKPAAEEKRQDRQPARRQQAAATATTTAAVTKPNGQGEPAAQQEPKQEGTGTPQQEQQTTSATDPEWKFEAVLMNSIGEPIEDTDGTTGEVTQAVIRDPWEFAQWIASQLPMSQNPEAFWENNADSIEAARAASADADKLLEEAHRQMEVTKEQRAQQLADQAAMEERRIAQEQAAREQADRERAQAAQQQAAPQKQEPAAATDKSSTYDKDMDFAVTSFVPEFEKVRTQADFSALMAHTGFQRFWNRTKTESPDIHQLLIIAVDGAKERIGMKA